MGAGLKQLKVISHGEDGSRERVPVSGGHRDKRIGERAAGSIFKNRVFLAKRALMWIIDFSSTELTP